MSKREELEARLREIGAVRKAEPAFYKDEPTDQVNVPLSVLLYEVARVAPVTPSEPKCDCGAGPGSAVCKTWCATRTAQPAPSPDGEKLSIRYCPEHGDLLTPGSDGTDVRSARCRESHSLAALAALAALAVPPVANEAKWWGIAKPGYEEHGPFTVRLTTEELLRAAFGWKVEPGYTLMSSSDGEAWEAVAVSKNGEEN